VAVQPPDMPCSTGTHPQRLAQQLARASYSKMTIPAFSGAAGGQYKRLGHPVVLSLAGLVSGAVSTYKYWNS
jgi:hypothetical protein